MQRFGGMHEGARYAQALHGRLDFAPHQPALADSADDELAAGFVGLCYCLDCAQQTIARHIVGLVEDADLGERSGGGGEDIDGARKKARAFRVVCSRWRGKRLSGRASAFALERRGLRRGGRAWWGSVECWCHVEDDVHVKDGCG